MPEPICLMCRTQDGVHSFECMSRAKAAIETRKLDGKEPERVRYLRGLEKQK